MTESDREKIIEEDKARMMKLIQTKVVDSPIVVLGAPLLSFEAYPTPGQKDKLTEESNVMVIIFVLLCLVILAVAIAGIVISMKRMKAKQVIDHEEFVKKTSLTKMKSNVSIVSISEVGMAPHESYIDIEANNEEQKPV